MKYIIRLFKNRSCPKCGSSNIDGDNLNAWCNSCGFFWN